MGKIVVTNPTRKRKFGWNYSTTVIDDGSGGWSIKSPEKPFYIGTLKQVRRNIRLDATYQALRNGGIYIADKWFYDGKPIRQWSILDTISDIDGATEPLQETTLWLDD